MLKRMIVALLSCVMLACLLTGCVVGPEGQSLYPLNYHWEKSGNGFMVSGVSVQDSFECEDGAEVVPDEGYMLLVLDCTIQEGERWKFCTDVTVKKREHRAESYGLKCEPIPVDEDTGEFVLIFEIPDHAATPEDVAEFVLSAEFEKSGQRVGGWFMLSNIK